MTWQGALKPVKSGTFTPVVTHIAVRAKTLLQYGAEQQ